MLRLLHAGNKPGISVLAYYTPEYRRPKRMHRRKKPGHLAREVLAKIFLILDTEALYIDKMKRAKQVVRMFFKTARQLLIINQKAGEDVSEETCSL